MTASFFNLNATFAVELAVFTIVLAVLTHFVIKPLQAAMLRRQAEIDQSLAKARRVEELLAAAEADYQATLNQARREARQIMATAQRMADNHHRIGRQPGSPDPASSSKEPRGVRAGG